MLERAKTKFKLGNEKVEFKNKLEKISQTAILKKRGYTILSKLGEGSYAKVYLGEFVRVLHDQPQGPTIKLAVKIMETKYGHTEFFKKFLPRELNILTRIDHPHIIHIHSILQIGLKFYIFMRFAEQGDLLDFIGRNGLINENQARVWTRQIALALQYLHVLNIAHRDMKCENILVTMNYNVKLSDFGFSRYTVDLQKCPVLSETYCGSLSYASPEILSGHPYNAKLSDVWSFGVVIYVMLNKSLPFNGSRPKAMLANQLKRNYKFRSKVGQILSKEVIMLVNNLLEPDPMKRYRIEGVINSNWIAMDKRLIALRPFELTALSTAFESQLTPPDNFALKLNVINKKSSQVVIQSEKISCENNICIIKPYQSAPPRISENSKIPMKQPDKETLNRETGEIHPSHHT